MENQSQKSIEKFLSELITAIRKISIYPPKHPIVVNSIKTACGVLPEIFSRKETFNISLSPDNKLLIEGGMGVDKNVGSWDDIALYLKKLDIENITFHRGILDNEIENFIHIISLEAERVKKAGDINKTFTERGIAHIKVGQFSYIKVEKDKETIVLEGTLPDLESLKARIKDFSQGKIEESQQLKNLEHDLFGLMSRELKEKRKLSPAMRSMLRKYIATRKDSNDALAALRNALIGFGCPTEDVDSLIGKIQEELEKGPAVRAKRASREEVEGLKKENEDLRNDLRELASEVERKTAELEQVKKQARVISSEKERTDNIIRHMADGLVVVDPQGKILLMNQQAQMLLGGQQKDVGKPIKELVKDEYLLTLVKDIPVDKDEIVQKDIELICQNESTKKVLRTSSAVVEDHNGKTVGMVTILNDITKQKEIDQLKSNFVASVSHELRTPLVAMEKSIHLILSKTTGEISSSQEQFLSIAERNLKRLTLLINDLLDLSKLESGKMHIDIAPSSIEKAISDTVESLAAWAHTKAITLAKEVTPGIPLTPLDHNKIIQVLHNLIGNSIKFTPANGRITVKAALVEENKAVEVAVEDSGIGIDQENLAKIFDKFFQIREKVSEVAGTGIGLAIAKEIIELHGGRIWAESEKDKGSRFIFRLPLQAIEETQPQP